MMKLRGWERLALTATACAGLAVGAAVVASAVTTPNSDAGNGADSPILTVPEYDNSSRMMPAVKGDEKAIFSDAVSAVGLSKPNAADDRVSVSLSAGANGEICHDIRLSDGGSAPGCASPEILRTGFAYVAVVGHDGVMDVVGIVPDDVAYVEIAGSRLKVANNVWISHADPNADMSYSVVGRDGRVASLDYAE